ncbi:hypothetical protein [Halorussus ruber]|uniref:hypothetical protein n=1 Tax=Halorussus ruber TaxID=1126238 RepID=UPI0010930D42|nr:hypothetical protein [Halorussus ruber]
MPSETSDEELDRVVRRAVRAELELLAGRIFWTLVATVGIFAGFGLVTMSFNAAGWNLATGAFLALGVALIGLGIRTLLLKWDLPPYSPEGGRV